MAAGPTMVGVIPAPMGVVPDFSGKRTGLQHQLIVIYSAMTALSTVVLAARLYTRGVINRTLGLDDFIIVLSWIGCIAWVAISFCSFQFGFGQHLWNTTPIQLQGYLRMLVGIGLVYVWTPALQKLSLLVMYHRLTPARWTRYSCYALGVLLLGYSIGFTVVIIGPCNPMHGNIQCLKELNLTMAIFSIVTDALIILLPIPMLHQLHLPMRQRFGLGLVFTLGSGVMITSIVRIIYVYQWIANIDSTYYQGSTCIFSVVEMNAGIICTSIVLLKPFVTRFFPGLFTSSSKSGPDRPPSNSNHLSKSWRAKRKDRHVAYELQSKGADYHDYVKDGGDVGITEYGAGSVNGKSGFGDGESTQGIIEPVIESDHARR